MKATCRVSCSMNKILYFLRRAKGRTSHLECPTNILVALGVGVSSPKHHLDICRNKEHVHETWRI